MYAGIWVHPCIHLAIYRSIHPSIRPSIYPSDLASIIPSLHTRSHAAGRVAHTCTHARTHMYTCKSTHLSILCPSCPSVARIHTRTFSHAHIYAYMHAYSTGPIAQLAARQNCNLSSIQGSWYRTHVQPNSFRGNWSWWAGFYSNSLSTAESSNLKAVVINLRKCALFVLVNCLGGIRMPGNSVCRLADRVRHDRNSVYLHVKRQSNKFHTY